MPRHDREVHAWSLGPHLLKRGHEASPGVTDSLGTSFGTNFQVETNVEHWAREPDCTKQLEFETDFEGFFAQAPEVHPNSSLIKGRSAAFAWRRWRIR